MNLKLTKRDVLSNIGGLTRSSGYCQLQRTISVLMARGDAKEVGYNSGIYGWNWTRYVITDENGNEAITLTTGYRSLVGERVKRETCSFLERQAENLKTKAIIEALTKSTEK